MSSAYVGLFLAAFGAATLLPVQSEAVMVGLLLLRDHSPWVLVTVASVGNVLGSGDTRMVSRTCQPHSDRLACTAMDDLVTPTTAICASASP
jgi:membrane protein YqaA with SNARE-associated domain